MSDAKRTIIEFTLFALAFLLIGLLTKAFSAERSPEWELVRAAYITFHPDCEACGGKNAPQVHHVLPFHLFPELELDPENLITLCRWHHLALGHLGDFSAYNPLIREDAKRHLERVKMRPTKREDKAVFEQAFRVAQ